jgi:hypothetical protein
VAEDCRHVPQLYFTRRWQDRLRRRYWIECPRCDLKLGPITDAAVARKHQRVLWRG